MYLQNDTVGGNLLILDEKVIGNEGIFNTLFLECFGIYAVAATTVGGSSTAAVAIAMGSIQSIAGIIVT